jgi:hypothetical protein
MKRTMTAVPTADGQNPPACPQTHFERLSILVWVSGEGLQCGRQQSSEIMCCDKRCSVAKQTLQASAAAKRIFS